jgi:hypothetical protein
MLQPNFDPEPTEVRIHRCGYVSKCKARDCLKRATVIAEKVDTAGRHCRQIELCARHCDIVIERELARALRFATEGKPSDEKKFSLAGTTALRHYAVTMRFDSDYPRKAKNA